MTAAKFLTSASEPRGFPREDAPEVAFVGRSNSGKSSAINAITGMRKLARVSKTPGRTQLINFFELDGGRRRIVDLPGYGFAKAAPEVRQRWRGLLEAYLSGRRCLRGLVVTVDIRRGLTELDDAMLEWAEALGLPLLLLLTKADKVSRSEAARQRRRVAEGAPSGTGLIVFSAPSGRGVDEARDALERWFDAPGVERARRSAGGRSAGDGQKKAPGGNRGASK